MWKVGHVSDEDHFSKELYTRQNFQNSPFSPGVTKKRPESRQIHFSRFRFLSLPSRFLHHCIIRGTSAQIIQIYILCTSQILTDAFMAINICWCMECCRTVWELVADSWVGVFFSSKGTKRNSRGGGGGSGSVRRVYANKHMYVCRRKCV